MPKESTHHPRTNQHTLTNVPAEGPRGENPKIQFENILALILWGAAGHDSWCVHRTGVQQFASQASRWGIHWQTGVTMCKSAAQQSRSATSNAAPYCNRQRMQHSMSKLQSERTSFTVTLMQSSSYLGCSLYV